MKHPSLLISLCLVAGTLACVAGEATETNAPSGPFRTFQRSGDSGGPREHGMRGGPGPGSTSEARYVETWLAQLKLRNPEDFEKARKLRDENPEEFRRHLREKLAEMKSRGGLNEHPAVLQALKSLPDADREWVMQRLQGGPSADRFGMRGGGNFLEVRTASSPDLERGELALRELVRKTRAATGDDKEKLRTELKTELGRLFDLREKHRSEQLHMVEQQVLNIREQLQERAGKRDEIIERHMQEALSATPTPPPAPARAAK